MGHMTLKVIPGSKRPGINVIKDYRNQAHRSNNANEPSICVRLCEKAQDNKANIALEKTLRKKTGFPVRIIRGAKNKIKVVEFNVTFTEFISKLQDSIQ